MSAVMSNALFTYGFPIFAVTVLALITWGPTMFIFYRKRRRGETVLLRHLSSALIIELAAVVALAVVADAFGLLNPGGYLLAIALLIGAAGAQVFSAVRFKHDS
jgi:hypothetical protein